MKKFDDQQCFIEFFQRCGFDHIGETVKGKFRQRLELTTKSGNKILIFVPEKGFPRYGKNLTNSKAFPKEFFNVCVDAGRKILETEF